MSFGAEPTPALASPSAAPGHLIACRCDSRDQVDTLSSVSDCLDPLPLDKFLARQNQEFRAAIPALAGDRPSERAPWPCPTTLDHPDTTLSHPSSWPRIGDVAPIPHQDTAPRIRSVYQFIPPTRAGCFVDLIV